MKRWVAQPKQAGVLTGVCCLPNGFTRVWQHFQALELITLETTDEVNAVAFLVWLPCDTVTGNFTVYQLPAKLVVP